MPKRKTKNERIEVSVRLPSDIVSKVERIAEVAGTDSSTVYGVLLALEICGHLKSNTQGKSEVQK